MNIIEKEFPVATINRAYNGWIIETPSWLENDAVKMVSQVFEIDEEESKQAKLVIAYMMRTILEEVGHGYSKHNKYNVEIRVVDEEGKEVEG